MESSTVGVSYFDQLGVQQLPNELLAKIFACLCCEPINEGERMQSMLTSPSPIWDLQKVCMRWRRIVRSTSSLWSLVNVLTCDASNDIVSQRIQTCLKLSRTAPLSIYLSHSANFRGPFKLLHQIVSEVDRWGSLTIYGSWIEDIVTTPELMDLVKKRGIAQLRKLTLKLSGSLDDEAFNFFANATTLEEVNFLEIHTTLNTSKFPWVGVKKLQIVECHLDGQGGDNISIFGALSSLEELILIRNFIILDSIPQDLVVPLLALHSVMIEEPSDLGGYNPDEPIPQYWRLYRTPSLTNIHIINDIRICFEYFSSMIRTASSVKTLRLESCSTTFFRKVIGQLPDVEELSLINMKDLNEVISQLIWDPENNETSTNLLPSLQNLVINHDSITTATAKRGEQQLSTPTASPLQFVKCYFVDPKEHCASSLAQLNSYGGESGIQVKVEIGNRK
ncbi:hypothetical protein BDQ17DRAFT_458270 [Cyathus striatus]|nr:hypothetical protein BDQ17DRAFT_458270 [Cyathus striatus]